MNLDKEALSAQIISNFQSNNFSALVESSENLIKLDPKEVLGWKALGIALFKLSQNESAVEKLKKASSLAEYDYEIFNILGVIYQEKNYSLSEKYFKKALLLNGNYIEALINLANLNKNNKQFEDSIPLYERVLLLDQNHFDTNVNIADAFFETKQDHKAIEYYQNALKLNPTKINVYMKLALTYHNKKMYNDSIGFLRKALLIEPNNKILLNNLGAALELVGEVTEAFIHFKKSTTVDENYLEAHMNIGNLHYKSNNFDSAIERYKKVIDLNPGFVNAFKSIGNAYSKKKDLVNSLRYFLKALKYDKSDANITNSIGSLYFANKNYRRAEFYFVKSLIFNPQYAPALNNMAQICEKKMWADKAEEFYLKAIKVDNNFLQAKVNLAHLFIKKDLLNESEAILKGIVENNQSTGDVFQLLGLINLKKGHYVESFALYKSGINLDSTNAHYFNNAGLCLEQMGKLTDALFYYDEALKINPLMTEIYINRAVIFRITGNIERALIELDKALDIDPASIKSHVSKLFMLCCQNQVKSIYYKESLNKFSQLTKRKSFLQWNCNPSPKKLRIGMVSFDFKNHPVSMFLEDLLINLANANIEIYAYSLNIIADDVTNRIKPFFTKWTTFSSASSSKDRAECIFNDDLHILFDLAGHTGGNDLEIFSYKPAPVQVTWLGYFASTGIEAIDYILCDEFVVPDSNLDDFVEKPWKMTSTYLSFSKPKFDLNVSPLPALNNGYITFGCFNNVAKLTNEVICLWSRILIECKDSILFLRSTNLDDLKIRNELLSQFMSYGVETSRIIFEGRSSREDLLLSYHRVDIALDPFPYPGGTTSCEAIWMGVPVITKEGNSFLSNMGVSIAHNSGNDQFIAKNDNEYLEKAIFFSSNIELLSEIRSSMRNKINKLPLFNASLFAVDFEAQMWKMWEKYKALSDSK